MASAPAVEDLRRLAKRRAPRAVFDYVDGAAEEERTLARATNAFSRVEFKPRVLRDVSKVDTTTTVLGRSITMPLIFAPTGFTRMMHAEGEPAVASVAAESGIPYALSALGTTSIEALSHAVPGGDRWFQLYMPPDRAASKDMLDRARDSGYSTLVLTVDTAVGGARLRDLRNGLTVPPTLSWKSLLEGALHPAWWFDFVTTPPLEFANLRSSDGTVAMLLDKLFDPAVTFDDITWIRSNWDRPVVVKGIQHADDAVQAVASGADAILLSNHGGRQLDRAPVPLEILPEVVEAVGDTAEVYIDGGVRTGADVAAAVALGARAVAVGRAYLYGLMAGGEPGVRRVWNIFYTDYIRTLRLLGCASTRDLEPSLVTLRRA